MASLLESGSLQHHVFHTLQPCYERRYRILVSSVEKYLIPLGVTLPISNAETVGGYFIWLTLPAPLLAHDVAKRAKEEESLIVLEGSVFGVRGDSNKDLDNKIRLCFSWEAEDLLVEGIQRLGRVVERIQMDTFTT